MSREHFALLAAAIQQYAYGGSIPTGWSLEQDTKIGLRLAKRYGFDEVLCAVRGLPVEHRPVSMRWLMETERFLECVSRGRQAEARGAAMTAFSALLAHPFTES